MNILFCRSAFKHKVSEADIRWAIDTVKYDGYLEDDDAENKRLLSDLIVMQNCWKYITIFLIKIQFGYFMQ